MAVELKFNREEILTRLRSEIWARVVRAVVFFHTTVLAAIGVHNPPPYRNSSKPGEVPKKRTGFLQANTQRELHEDELAGRVGVNMNAKYGLYLEFGTRKMAARPFLSTVAALTRAQVAAMVGGNEAA